MGVASSPASSTSAGDRDVLLACLASAAPVVEVVAAAHTYLTQGRVRTWSVLVRRADLPAEVRCLAATAWVQSTDSRRLLTDFDPGAGPGSRVEQFLPVRDLPAVVQMAMAVAAVAAPADSTRCQPVAAQSADAATLAYLVQSTLSTPTALAATLGEQEPHWWLLARTLVCRKPGGVVSDALLTGGVFEQLEMVLAGPPTSTEALDRAQELMARYGAHDPVRVRAYLAEHGVTALGPYRPLLVLALWTPALVEQLVGTALIELENLQPEDSQHPESGPVPVPAPPLASVPVPVSLVAVRLAEGVQEMLSFDQLQRLVSTYRSTRGEVPEQIAEWLGAVETDLVALGRLMSAPVDEVHAGAHRWSGNAVAALLQRTDVPASQRAVWFWEVGCLDGTAAPWDTDLHAWVALKAPDEDSPRFTAAGATRVLEFLPGSAETVTGSRNERLLAAARIVGRHHENLGVPLDLTWAGALPMVSLVALVAAGPRMCAQVGSLLTAHLADPVRAQVLLDLVAHEGDRPVSELLTVLAAGMAAPAA